jgi:hypothetical protein
VRCQYLLIFTVWENESGPTDEQEGVVDEEIAD